MVQKKVESRAFARAGLLGNPSDGYQGRTISFAIEQYYASVAATESDKVIIQAGPSDRLEFSSADDLSQQIDDSGFYGGVRLIKSAIKRLHDHCVRKGLAFDRNFSIGYDSNIPRQVGLAGSSAIVVATLRCLCQWHDIEIEPAVIAGLALQSESALGITAGPQDRVIQAFDGAMYMDFSDTKPVDGVHVGSYTRLDVDQDHNFYVAFNSAESEPTEVLHGDLKSRMQAGDANTVAAIGEISELPLLGREAVETNDLSRLSDLINRNFDLRKKVCDLNPYHVKMVETARGVGASAKYCGSGGAIVGTYSDDSMYESLSSALGSIGCTVIRPKIAHP